MHQSILFLPFLQTATLFIRSFVSFTCLMGLCRKNVCKNANRSFNDSFCSKKRMRISAMLRIKRTYVDESTNRTSNGSPCL